MRLEAQGSASINIWVLRPQATWHCVACEGKIFCENTEKGTQHSLFLPKTHYNINVDKQKYFNKGGYSGIANNRGIGGVGCVTGKRGRVGGGHF
jgi:hypothetical protein